MATAETKTKERAEQKAKERTTVYLTQQLKQTITHEAEEAGQPLSTWVERAITSHLKAKAAAHSTAMVGGASVGPGSPRTAPYQNEKAPNTEYPAVDKT